MRKRNIFAVVISAALFMGSFPIYTPVYASGKKIPEMEQATEAQSDTETLPEEPPEAPETEQATEARPDTETPPEEPPEAPEVEQATEAQPDTETPPEEPSEAPETEQATEAQPDTETPPEGPPEAPGTEQATEAQPGTEAPPEEPPEAPGTEQATEAHPDAETPPEGPPEAPGTEQATEAQPDTETPPEEPPEAPETEQATEAQPGMETLPEEPPEAHETETTTEVQTDTETQPETSSEASGTEPATEVQTDMETPPETSPETSGTEPATEVQTEAETPSEASETEQETEPMSEEYESEMLTGLQEEESETEEESGETFEDVMPGNSGYVPGGNYYWDASWYLPADFRFTKVEKNFALVECENNIAYVYEEASADAKRVGEIQYFGIAYVLEEKDGWVYIESGNLRGFVKAENLNKGIFVDELIEVIGENSFQRGKSYVEPFDNAAFTYTHTTIQEVIAEKQAGIMLYSCSILEYADPYSRTIGTASSGNLVYILTQADNGWYFVESGDVRGFIDPAVVLTGQTAEKLVETEGEDAVGLAEEVVAPEENRSCYFTLKSVQVAGSNIGTKIVEYALGFVGNLPYVWGGTSLTAGADCSGFTQAVFGSFGVNIPRLAEEQGVNGQEITSFGEAKAGDIVYYASGPHVGIYIGNGMVVQCSGRSYNSASNPGKGPTISQADYMPVTSIRRYLIETGNRSGSGRLDLTDYTEEQLQLIWAIVAQEDNGSYEGALAVISSAMNRTESIVWGYCGRNALSQLTASGQYCYSADNFWKPRLNGNVPDYVKQAVNDCLKKGIRNHSYTCFRSRKGKTTGNNAVQIGGNWYFGS